MTQSTELKHSDEIDTVNTLISRLSRCSAMLLQRQDARISQQILLYSAYLSDLKSGRIPMNRLASEMMLLVREFCDLAET